MQRLEIKVLSSLLLGCVVFYGALNAMERDIVVQHDPHSIVDLLHDNGSYLKQLIKEGSGINYCHELCIAHQTLASFFDEACYDWDRSLYSMNVALKNEKQLEERFGHHAVVLANNLLKQQNIRKNMFSHIHIKDKNEFDEGLWYEKYEKIRRIIKINDLATLNLRDYSPGSGGQALMHYVVLKTDSMFLKTMLDNGANPHMLDKFKRSPLFYAIKGGLLTSVKLLLKHKACPRIQDCDGNTPLHWAVVRKSNQKKIISALSSYGADPNATNKWGETPLHFALDNEKVKAIKCLLALPLLDLFKRNNRGQSYLDIARSKDYLDLARLKDSWCVRFILNCQLFRAFTDHSYDKTSKCKEVAELIKAGANVHAHNIYCKAGWLHDGTILSYILNQKCEECLKLLIKHNVDVNNTLDKAYSWSYIHIPISNGFDNAISLLINAGAYVNSIKHQRNTPLFSAAWAGNGSAVNILLEYGAFIGKQTLYGSMGLVETHPIFQMLIDAYEKQECCVCFESQQSLDTSQCLLSYIPCKNNHRRNFMCKQCYDGLKIVDGKKQCPFNCKDGLGEFDES